MAKLRFIADRGVNLPAYWNWNDAISSFCRSEGFAFMADRFGFLNQFTRINAAAIDENRLPAFDSTIDFATCMNTRAEELLESCLRRGCKLHIMWSGGCDSTAVVAAMLHVGFPIEQLEVVYTKSSVEDYPEFFEYMKAAGLTLTLIPGYDIFPAANFRATNGGIVLTGFPADQLFGSIIGQRFEGDTTKTHWTEYLKSDVANQQYEAAFEHYNIPITTVAEFLWFNNFALKWDFVCYSGLMMCGEHHQNVTPFFDTQSFQDWSASNFDVLHRYDQKDAEHYKIQMKDYIYNLTKLPSVYRLQKVPSLAHAELLEPHPTNHVYTVASLDDAGVVMTRPIYPRRKPLTGAGIAATQLMRLYLKK